MSDDSRAAHLLADELLDYFEEKLPDKRQCEVEEHLANCDPCTAMARNVRAFDEAWDWTAEGHRALYQRELLARALEAAETDKPALRDRLRTWRQRWAGLAEAALRVAVKASAATVSVVAEGLDGLARPGSTWRFSPAEQAQSARGAPADETVSALLTTAVRPATPRARVAVRGGQMTEVEVRIDDLAPDAPSPVVLLIALELGQARSVRVVEAERRPGATYHIARFSNLAPGEYVVAFEPLAAPETSP